MNRRYIEYCANLNLTMIMKGGYFKAGFAGKTQARRGNEYTGMRETWGISWHIYESKIVVSYFFDNQRYCHNVNLFKQPVNFGGERVYLICPICSNRRKQIYFLGENAGCRLCVKIHYQCQSERILQRKYRRLDKLLDNKVIGSQGRFDTYRKIPFKHAFKFWHIDHDINLTRRFILGAMEAYLNKLERREKH